MTEDTEVERKVMKTGWKLIIAVAVAMVLTLICVSACAMQIFVKTMTEENGEIVLSAVKNLDAGKNDVTKNYVTSYDKATFKVSAKVMKKYQKWLIGKAKAPETIRVKKLK